MNMPSEISGRILRIEKGSIHDGDGLRTVIFLKGCPLHCAWCAAPESQESEYTHGYGCSMAVQEVLAEITKDEIFYFHSGGGVTISGGEPLMQPDFVAALLCQCKKMGINAAIETCAYGDYFCLEKIFPYLDVIYADIKHMDNEQHVRYTGVSNETILKNIKRMASDFPGKLRIRLPLVPSVNMDDEWIRAAAAFCKSLAKLDFVEFLPYHRLGIDTYSKLGLEYSMQGLMPPCKEIVYKAKEVFRKAAPGIRLL